MTTSAVTFAAVLPSLLVAHNVADHWIQTNHQAQHKGVAGWPGRIACAKHVATYTMATAATVGLLWAVFDLPITPAGLLLGQAVSAVTHYIADRRTPLEWIVQRWPFEKMGKPDFYRLGAPRKVAAWTQDQTQAIMLHRTDEPGEGTGPWDNPSLGTGAYALDQSWHWLWLFVAALITAVI